MAWKVKYCQSTSNKKIFIPLCTSLNPDSKNIVWHNTFHQFGSYCRWKNTSGSSCTRRFAIESQDRHQSEWKSRKRIAFLVLSESELVGWSESRNLELFYYLGHNYLPTFHGIIFKREIGFGLSVADVSLFNRQPVTQRQEMVIGFYALLFDFISVKQKHF